MFNLIDVIMPKRRLTKMVRFKLSVNIMIVYMNALKAIPYEKMGFRPYLSPRGWRMSKVIAQPKKESRTDQTRLPRLLTEVKVQLLSPIIKSEL